MQGVNLIMTHRGLKLPGHVRRRLRDVGILARAEVSLEHQHLARRYVLRGVESGGAVREVGHYVTFAGEGGEPLAYLHPIDAIGVNGLHAVAVAPALVRVEMLRTGRTYELLIPGHRVGEAEKGRRPAIESKVLFQGVHGYLDGELWRKDKEYAGAVMPSFYSLAGEPVKVPRRFEAVTRAVVRGTNCWGCAHSHYLIAGLAAGTVVVETMPVALPRPAIESVDLGMAAAGVTKREGDQTG